MRDGPILSETNLFHEALDQFNSREFYSCHDTLEALWMEALEPERRFYQGLLQIAVGYYHLGNGNWRGCVILLGEGLGKLRPFCPEHHQIDLGRFVDQNELNLGTLHALGPEKLNEFCLDQIPQIRSR